LGKDAKEGALGQRRASITVAVAEPGRQKARLSGQTASVSEAMAELAAQLDDGEWWLRVWWLRYPPEKDRPLSAICNGLRDQSVARPRARSGYRTT
jgi:hypothetical protein